VFTFPRPGRARPVAVLALLALSSLTACGNDDGGGAGDRTKVVASFYPVAWLAGKVGGGDVVVSTLTRPGTEPHDLELTPRQVADVGRADFAIYIRGVQPAVDDAVAKQARDKALDAASVVKTLPPPAEDEHGHGAEKDEHGDEKKAEFDPHLWLDPSRMATVATTLGERLAATDPAHAAGYRSRAAALAKELTTLDQSFRDTLRPCKNKTLVTAHAAFGYLAARYGLRQVAIAGVDPTNEPSPKRLAELTHEIEETGARTVFTETLVSPKVAESLARAAKVRTAVLDPVEGIEKGSADDYLSIMRKNLRVLGTSLECLPT
jgi:zinc transport system substrate-binding protein